MEPFVIADAARSKSESLLIGARAYIYSVPFPCQVTLRPLLFRNHTSGITSPRQVKIILIIINHKQLNTGTVFLLSQAETYH